MGALFGLLIPVIVIAAIVIGGRRVFSHRTAGAERFSIRRFFQYLLQFAVLVVSAVGVSGLLARLLESGRVIVETRTDLARNLTFTIVGVPITWGLVAWTRRTLAENPKERESFGWSGYLTVTTITSLAVSMFGARDFLMWAIGNESYRGAPIARFIVWSGIWYLHWRALRNVKNPIRPDLFIGSAIGLATMATGFGGVIGHAIERLINIPADMTLVQRTDPIIGSATVFVVGAPVWFEYWVRHARSHLRDALWYSYLFLAGIASGFITAVVSTSVVIYDALVWFFGDTGGRSAERFFFRSAGVAGSALTGLALWWYHRSILDEVEVEGAGIRQRTEVRRIYEYIISGVSLIATGVGLMMVLVAAIESFSPKALATSAGNTNTLLVAITLLIVGSPIWWYFWNRIERNVAVDPREQISITRRIFLMSLFGVSGIASVVSVLTGVFLFMDDLLNSQLSRTTLHDARFAISILITNAAISWYHWSLYRTERHHYPHQVRSEKHVVLVGPSDGHIASDIKARIGGSVELWISPDSQAEPNLSDKWDIDALVDLIEESSAEELMILNEKRKPRVIPFSRE